jgi:Mycothiol maleylpyruvate isomerase N-terminal domain
MFKREGLMANSYDETNRRSLEDLKTFVERLSDEQLARDLGNGWTPAAELAHIAFWDRRATQIAIRVSADETFRNSAENVHVLNDALLPQWKRIAPRDAIAELVEAGTEVNNQMAAADQATVERWLELRTFAVDRSNHRVEHLEELKQFFG